MTTGFSERGATSAILRAAARKRRGLVVHRPPVAVRGVFRAPPAATGRTVSAPRPGFLAGLPVVNIKDLIGKAVGAGSRLAATTLGLAKPTVTASIGAVTGLSSSQVHKTMASQGGLLWTGIQVGRAVAAARKPPASTFSRALSAARTPPAGSFTKGVPMASRQLAIGQVLPPEHQVVRVWQPFPGGPTFARLADGHIAVTRKDGTIKHYRPYRPVVIPRKWNARSMGRVATALKRQRKTATQILRITGGVPKR